MKTFALFSLIIAIFALSCNYDPSPVGCRFRVEDSGFFTVEFFDFAAEEPGYKDLSFYDYEGDSLTAEDKAQIFATMDMDTMYFPVSFVVNIAVQNMGTEGSLLLEEFVWVAKIAAGGRQYTVGLGEVGRIIEIFPSQMQMIALPIAFNAMEIFGEYLTNEEILDLCLDLGFRENGSIRNDKHLGRVTIEAVVVEDDPHGYIRPEPFVIGLDWVQPE